MRVSKAEKAAFKLAAASSDQDLSVWIRVVLHEAAKKELASITDVATNLGGVKNVQHRKTDTDSLGSV